MTNLHKSIYSSIRSSATDGAISKAMFKFQGLPCLLTSSCKYVRSSNHTRLHVSGSDNN